MKLPIICSNIGGNIDIVTHQDTGLIYDTYNEADMQEKMEWALNHKDEMAKMSEKLYEKVTTEYKRETFWAQMNQQYKKLIKENNILK